MRCYGVPNIDELYVIESELTGPVPHKRRQVRHARVRPSQRSQKLAALHAHYAVARISRSGDAFTRMAKKRRRHDHCGRHCCVTVSQRQV